MFFLSAPQGSLEEHAQRGMSCHLKSHSLQAPHYVLCISFFSHTFCKKEVEKCIRNTDCFARHKTVNITSWSKEGRKEGEGGRERGKKGGRQSGEEELKKRQGAHSITHANICQPMQRYSGDHA